jgi:hypothetical protein
MPDADYRRALDTAVRELEQALAQRQTLDGRIAQLKQTVGTLNKLCGYEPTVPWSLTDACRTVLRSAAAPLTAVQIRERFETIGLDTTRYANALSAIHTVLKRLEETGEIIPSRDDESTRVAYAFLGSGIVASRTTVRPTPRRRIRRRKERS